MLRVFAIAERKGAYRLPSNLVGLNLGRSRHNDRNHAFIKVALSNRFGQTEGTIRFQSVPIVLKAVSVAGIS